VKPAGAGFKAATGCLRRFTACNCGRSAENGTLIGLGEIPSMAFSEPSSAAAGPPMPCRAAIAPPAATSPSRSICRRFNFASAIRRRFHCPSNANLLRQLAIALFPISSRWRDDRDTRLLCGPFVFAASREGAIDT
jgi:hypothetical protein